MSSSRSEVVTRHSVCSFVCPSLLFLVSLEFSLVLKSVIGVSRMFKGCSKFKGVSRKFLGCLNEV